MAFEIAEIPIVKCNSPICASIRFSTSGCHSDYGADLALLVRSRYQQIQSVGRRLSIAT